MVAREEIVAIVPARGGSRSIPGKNIKLFGRHPLLAYSVAAGNQSELVGSVYVSTDDDQIASSARRYDPVAIIDRPKSLAQDDTLDLPVFQHALEWLASEEDLRPEVIVQLRPTSPLRPHGCVDEAIQLLLDHPEADSVRAVVSTSQDPFKMWRLEGERLSPLLERSNMRQSDDNSEPYNMPRQALPHTYWQTGQIDVIRTRTILERGSLTGQIILPWILEDPLFAVDLNSAWEWSAAEALLGKLDCVRPGRAPRPLPEHVELLVLDFDGVLTDDRVWVGEDRQEHVAAHRGDGYGIARLKERGVSIVVLSAEENSVVAARCEKLGVEAVQGITDKRAALQNILEGRNVEKDRTVYVGNDVNDLECFDLVACAVAVADAHATVLERADLRLRRTGGHGAVRELADLILQKSAD